MKRAQCCFLWIIERLNNNLYSTIYQNFSYFIFYVSVPGEAVRCLMRGSDHSLPDKQWSRYGYLVSLSPSSIHHHPSPPSTPLVIYKSHARHSISSSHLIWFKWIFYRPIKSKDSLNQWLWLDLCFMQFVRQ